MPRLNIDWTQLDLAALSDRFGLVIVAPRGFGPSARPGRYDATTLVDDVRRVLDHLEISSYATFGYSMNGVMAALLALKDPRVTAVACGGFPLTADLTGMGERARTRNTAARQDPDGWAEVLAAYDPEAAVAFWDAIARLPRAALADIRQPMRLWWGEADTVVSSLIPSDELARDLALRGIPYDIVPGLSHDGMLDRLDLVLPTIAAWLADQPTS
jgi:pimeloyl-ACP methyl ester carboxylesterase